jgi:folate-binding protein YgfZ
MPRSPLYDKLAAAGARLGEYGGAETALAFSAPEAELRELRAACAAYDLGWRAKLLVTGGDRVRWLNGMLSNNIRDLPLGRGNYNFLLNPQGRILADMYVYNRGDYLLLDTDAWQAPQLREIFEKYIIMDDVEVTEVGEKLTALGVQGPKSRAVLRAAGLEISATDPLQVADLVWNGIGCSLTRTDVPLADTFEIWLAPANVAAAWDGLLAASAKPVGTEALTMFRLLAGVPQYGRDIRDRDLPQETGQDRALNFQKGCYLGQEIVERIHSRGQVHRKLTGLVVDGAPPAPGAKVQAGGKEVGEVTSALAVPINGGKRTLALGYIRREAGSPGAEVQVDGARAVVAPLPFKLD